MRAQSLALLLAACGAPAQSAVAPSPATPAPVPMKPRVWTRLLAQPLAEDVVVSAGLHVGDELAVKLFRSSSNGTMVWSHDVVVDIARRTMRDGTLADPREHRGDRTLRQDGDHLMLDDGRGKHRLDPRSPAGYEPCFVDQRDLIVWHGYDPKSKDYALYTSDFSVNAQQLPGTLGVGKAPVLRGTHAYAVRFDRRRDHPYYGERRGPDHACLIRVDLDERRAIDLGCNDRKNSVALAIDPSGTTGVTVSRDDDLDLFACEIVWRRLADGRELARHDVRCKGADSYYLTDDGLLAMPGGILELTTGRWVTLDVPQWTVDWDMLDNVHALAPGVLPLVREHWIGEIGVYAHHDQWEVAALDMHAALAQ